MMIAVVWVSKILETFVVCLSDQLHILRAARWVDEDEEGEATANPFNLDELQDYSSFM